ncbi:DUF262 domain-containing protein [uncultured Alcanivorax sp.]|uniref:DUF262 domain-containing protein n=1 Tax=uncultured Alcanivorax sp. TaxID=191215 RepID=UPI0026103F4D|nr:DUF262 domain-containing HNH endonuclease family protein [uncultured Alcanivorax sp.]
MDAKARDLNQIFDGTISFQIPLFQRPYVWNKEKNWEPLWDDIQGLLDYEVQFGRHRKHFLGAVVLEQLKNVAGSIETHQVIDGQQRFTTLQLIMLAARDLANGLENEKYFDRFNDLVTNKASKVDYDHEKYKVWPTNRDREAFKALHESGAEEKAPLADLTLEQLFSDEHIEPNGNKMTEGYLYFRKQLRDWLAGEIDEMDESEKEVNPEERLDALWKIISGGLQVVVINLDDDDESQVIFETLNARGTQLLPADLVKNYLFRKAQAESQNIEELYKRHWSAFDNDFWRTEVTQGRAKRPRIDLFLQHYLTLMMREEVRPAHLFESFKEYVENQQALADLPAEKLPTKSNLSVMPVTTEEQLKALARYSQAFQTFAEPPAGSRLATFLKRLGAVDTATVYPLLLLACDQLLPAKQWEFDQFLTVLESFLMRRMVCGLTSKNYNRLFLDVIKTLDREGVLTANALKSILQSSEGDSVRFPSDEEFKHSILNRAIYQALAQYKIRAILEAIDQTQADRKSENLELPNDLTIEHVMPVNWELNWPIPEEYLSDAEAKLKFAQQRNQLIHALGNLTLITGSLNPSLSNGSWQKKRPELAKYSKLNLNRYFYPVHEGEDPLAEWNENTIANRGELLFDSARKVWPF